MAPMLAFLRLFTAVLPVIGYFLSWGVTRGGFEADFGAGNVTYVMHHTGSDAGAYGVLTLVFGIIIVAACLLALWRPSRNVLGGIVVASVVGAGIVVLGLTSHSDVGWPLGPNVAIGGFVATALLALAGMRTSPARKLIE